MASYVKLNGKDDFPAQFFPANILVSNGTKPRNDGAGVDALQAEVQKLTAELSRATAELGRVKKTLSNSSNTSSQSGQMDEKTALDRSAQAFSSLYHKDYQEVMAAFNKLPDVAGSSELQQTLLLSVAVLAFRKVDELLAKVEDNVASSIATCFETQEDSPDEDVHFTEIVQWPLRSYLKHKYWEKIYFNVSKSITSQIWTTLYDFPSLKTCQRFNRFILDSVRTAWNATVTRPGVRIECSADIFDSSIHVRCDANGSDNVVANNSGSDVIANNAHAGSDVIVKYIWPVLLAPGGQCLVKGVVLTE